MAQPPAQRPERLQLRVDGEEQPIDPIELDERLRSGAVPRGAEVKGPELTGGAWRRVEELPALAEALDAPDARFAARLRASPRVVLIPVFATLLIILALVQRASGWPGEGEAGLQAMYRVAAGQGPTLLDGRWWTMLSCHFAHAPEAPLAHLLGNLTTIGYCGYRVEKAWGWSGALRVLLGGAAMSALVVSLFGDVPVVGSSTLAFALWGAQIAIGFRQAEAIPAPWRRYYGYGNLVIFVPLYVSGLGTPGVSDWGHFGGLLGGALAALSGRPAVLAPAAAVGRAQLRAVAEGVGALVISVLIVILASQAPLWLLGWGRSDRLLLPSESAALTLPRGMAEPEAPLAAGGWHRLAVGSGAALLVEELRFRSIEAAAAHQGLDRLRSEDAPPAVELPAPAPLGPGWTAAAFALPPEATLADPSEVIDQDVVVIHELHRGLRLLRLVERYEGERALPANGAARALRGSLQGVELLERPELREARAAKDRSPNDRLLALRFAEALVEEGRWAEVDPLLAALSADSDGVAWEAARLRLAAWERGRALDGSHLDEEEKTDWVAPFLSTPLSDTAVHRPALAWLARRGACAEARGHLAWLEGQVPPEELDPDYAAVQQTRVDALAGLLLGPCPPVDAPPAAP